MILNRIVPLDRIARSQPADTLATSLKFTTMHHAHRAAFHSRPRMVCIVDLAGVIPVNILQRTIHYRVRGQCWHVIANQRATGLMALPQKYRTRLSLGENGTQRRFHRHLRDLMLGGGRPGKILKTPNVQLEASGGGQRMRLCRTVEQLKTR
ncbi:hypothetical protein ALC56_10751 [Trachymyrmex septentrionalis]|uniref:Uncharacterized protein n=1 Tax=Trachymyrmex septentrionalis TaxID=34720 RepID=A0A195F2U5_9HYME|nr:hypothetical protein ALC56_10751 [Trachymyrmex septentrionalis]